MKTDNYRQQLNTIENLAFAQGVDMLKRQIINDNELLKEEAYLNQTGISKIQLGHLIKEGAHKPIIIDQLRYFREDDVVVLSCG